MGLAASQGRLLTITAQMTSIEGQVEDINHKKLLVASQLDELSETYEEATSNKVMRLNVFNGSNQEGSPVTSQENLTYDLLLASAKSDTYSQYTGLNYIDGVDENNTKTTNGCYRLADVNGAVILADTKELPTDDNGNNICTPDGNNRFKGPDGTIYVIDPNIRKGSTDANGLTGGPNYLQDCLRNGKYTIQTGRVTENNGNKVLQWADTSWDSMTSIYDKYYTEDDDAAKIKYDRESNALQRTDKKYDLKLDNLETQHKALENDEESVQKVIDDAAEGFKAFG